MGGQGGLFSQNVSQGALDFGKLEDESELEQAAGEDSPAFEDDIPEFPQEQPHHEGRGAQERRAAERFSQRFGQVLVPEGMGGTGVDGAGNFRMFDQKDNDFDQVPDMNPGKPLPAFSQRAPDEKLEERSHHAQSSALLSEHDAEAGDDNPGPFLTGFQGFGLPSLRDRGQEIVARAGALIKFFIFMEAVIADSRGAKKGHFFYRASSEGLDDVLSRLNPALENELFLFFVPITEDGGSSEVYNNVAILDVFLPGAGLYGFSLDIRDTGVRLFGPFFGPSQNENSMPLPRQPPGKIPSCEPRSTRDKNPHDLLFRTPPNGLVKSGPYFFGALPMSRS